MPTEIGGLAFEVVATEGQARTGRLTTRHGAIETPAFMPVGTLGAVKGLGPRELSALGAQVMLSNLYHLAVRPGIEEVVERGGIHSFTGWSGPVLTDSGGYQVFSLEGLRELSEEGVRFRNHHDGRLMQFTPEDVVTWQQAIGVDIAMMLDECPPWPVERERARSALERTNRWGARARATWDERTSALFGIVQGSFYPDLRERAAAEIGELGFAGNAIGGISVGEGSSLGREIVLHTAPLLPADRPRYLMGLGTEADIAWAVSCGVDLFDCVLPTRNARHGNLFTSSGIVKIKNRKYRYDDSPIDPALPERDRVGVSRAFLHHLFKTGEITAKVLATRHNLGYFLDFMGDLRQALQSGSLAVTVAEVLEREALAAAVEP